LKVYYWTIGFKGIDDSPRACSGDIYEGVPMGKVSSSHCYPDEIEEVFYSRYKLRKSRQDRYLLYGITDSGRYLFVVFTVKKSGSKNLARIISARDREEFDFWSNQDSADYFNDTEVVEEKLELTTRKVSKQRITMLLDRHRAAIDAKPISKFDLHTSQWAVHWDTDRDILSLSPELFSIPACSNSLARSGT
jgi:hypothetical protein